MTDRIKEAAEKLLNYIVKDGYSGYDPYDGLMSPVMKLPLIRSTKIIKFGTQQIIRRLPINTRQALGIKKSINPVTLGLSIQAYTYLCMVYPEKKSKYIESIEKLRHKLSLLKSKGFSGDCWGYDFDWVARYASIEAFKPTVVATGMITNGLYEYYKYSGDITVMDMCRRSGEFVLKDLNRTYEDDAFCFSYSPYDRQIVYNATMKGARILAQSGFQTEEAKSTVKFVTANQRKDGAWSYSKGDTRKWVDNIHTGYVLDCLKEYRDCTNDDSVDSHLKKGFDYYINNFFYDGKIPKYYDNKIFPVDSTAISQSILTLCKFGYVELAGNVINWTLENMADKEGYFYYRKYKNYTNKISYMRWSNAWMLTALCYYLYKTK